MVYAVLIGGLLLSYHAYLSDCALLLPAATVVYAEARNPWLRLLGALLLTPFLYFLLIAERPATYSAQLAIAAFFGMHGPRRKKSSRPSSGKGTSSMRIRPAAVLKCNDSEGMRIGCWR